MPEGLQVCGWPCGVQMAERMPRGAEMGMAGGSVGAQTSGGGLSRCRGVYGGWRCGRRLEGAYGECRMEMEVSIFWGPGSWHPECVWFSELSGRW